MGGTGKKDKPPGKTKGKSKEAPPEPIKDDDIEDGDIEDGDIATPKRDRNGNDDEPL